MRVKRGVTTHQRHKKIRQATKGMQHSRRSRFRLGKQAVIRALQHSYRDRRTRKRVMRQLWIIRINAAVREHGLSYSEFIQHLEKSKIRLNRKSLAELAVKEPQALATVVQSLKK